MTAKMTQLEYAKSYAPASRIPESFLTMGDIVELLERIEELKAELANANEGARLLHSLATGGETSVLSRLDNGADVQDAVRWQDAPEYKEAQKVSDKFNFDTVKEQEF